MAPEKITGTTKSGFAFELDPDVFDDWDTVALLGDVQSGSPTAIIQFTVRVLGDAQTENLKNHVRTAAGRVPFSRMSDEILEIFKAYTASKNS